MGRKKLKHSMNPLIKEELSETTIDSLEFHRLKVEKSTGKDRNPRYSRKNKRQKLSFVNGFDLMQYNIIIRDYILKKYSIKNVYELDILLYLYPFQFFSHGDFNHLPTTSLGYSLKRLIELGFVTIIVKSSSARYKNVYGLTDRSKRAVKNYYMFLSGEKTLGDGAYKSPFKFQEKTKANKERRDLMLLFKKRIKKFPNTFTKGDY